MTDLEQKAITSAVQTVLKSSVYKDSSEAEAVLCSVVVSMAVNLTIVDKGFDPQQFCEDALGVELVEQSHMFEAYCILLLKAYTSMLLSQPKEANPQTESKSGVDGDW